MTTFAAQVKGWSERTKAKQLAVYRRAVQLLAEDMNKTVDNGGNLPHLTGNLMRSMLASFDEIQKGGPGAEYAGQDVGIVIASASLEDAIYLGWQAVYAHRLNFGFVGTDSLGRTWNQEGRHFVENAIAKWPEFVAQAAREYQ